MTVGSGLGSSLGSGIETTYGAGGGASPTMNLWNAVDKAEVKFNPVFFDGKGLRGGVLVQDTNDHVLVQGDAGGPVQMNAYFNGLGRWVATLFGSQTSGAPTSLGNGAYSQSHVWQNPWNQSLALQQAVIDALGNTHNWVTLGAKILQGDFTCTNGQSLQATFTVDAQDRFESASTITAPTEPTNDPFFTWKDMVVKVGAFGSESPIDGVMKWSSSLKRSFANKRFNAGNVTVNPLAGLANNPPKYAIKDQPVDNEFSQLTGSLDTEYLNDTLVNYFRNNTSFSLIVAFTSATTIATSTFKYSITFAFPCCYLIADDPVVSGPDIVKPVMNYVVRNDETHNVATVTIQSSESAL